MDLALKIAEGYRPPSKHIIPSSGAVINVGKTGWMTIPYALNNYSIRCSFCRRASYNNGKLVTLSSCCTKESNTNRLTKEAKEDFLTSETAVGYGPETSWSHPAPIQFWDSNYQFHPIHILKKRLSADMTSRALRIKNAHLLHSLSN